MEATVLSITENAVNINITPEQPIVKVLSGYAIAFGGIINPMTTFGDMIYADVTPSPTRLPGNITTTKNFLTQTGTGSISAAPAWTPLLFSDIPDLSSVYQPLLPNQTGNALKFLTTNGTTPSWANNFTWDATNYRLTVGQSNTNTQLSHNYIFGLSNSIDQGAWNFVLGEDNHMQKTGSPHGIGDSAIISGYQNKIILTAANPFSGIFETIILGGYDNVANDSTQGTMLGGNHNRLTTCRSATVGGEWSESAGYTSWVYGYQEDAGHAITPAPTQRVLASGTHAFNFSVNNNSQTVGHGALADRSVILGGRNSNIPADATGSGILGGDGIKARAGETHQWYLPNLNITSTPSNDNALVQVLVRDSSTGQIKYRSASTIGSALPSVNTGDILYGSATNVWSNLADVATGNALISGGVLTAPSWGKINLSTHVTGQLLDLYSIGGDRYKALAMVNNNNYTSPTSSRVYSSITFTTSNYTVWKPKIEFIFQVTGDGGGREQILAYIEYSTDNATWSTLSNTDHYITTDANAHTLVTVSGIHSAASISTTYYYRLNTSNFAGGNASYSVDFGYVITSIPI